MGLEMPRVLVVDDEPHVREVLRRALSQWGYEVVEAENGSDALEKFSQTLPEVVLMDVAMPVMDGFEALQKLREFPAAAGTPVIMVTTLPATQGEPIAMSLGSQHYINKPFDFDVLKSTIKVALRESHASTEEEEGLPPVSDLSETSLDPGGAEAEISANGALSAISTGIDLVDEEMGGGLSHQSLTLIEGTSEVGKSVLCQHLAHRALLNSEGVLYISSEETEQSFTDRMSYIGMKVSEYIRQGQLQVRRLEGPAPEEGSGHSIDLMSQMLQEAPQRYQVIIIDSITNQSILGQEEAIVTFFQSCKSQCQKGKTICVVTHSGILEEKLWLQLRSLLDSHIRFSLKPMGRNLVKTLEVLKANNTEVHTGNRIVFDVGPGAGILPVRLPASTRSPGAG